MTADTKIDKAGTALDVDCPMPDQVAKPYIVDMMEQLMLLAQGAKLTHLASGLDALLEPYRE